MAPRVSDVCGRFCKKNPLPFCSVVALVLGILTTFATLLIGYYYAYNDNTAIGLCYEPEYPSLRRTCLLDMTGSVLAMIIACLLLILECFSAYINQRDWRIAFFVVKLFLLVITLVVLITATIYGLVTYLKYCDDTEKCKFSHRSDDDDYGGYGYDYNSDQTKINKSVDFVVIVIISGVGSVWWGLWLLVEGLRTFLEVVSPENYQNLRNADQRPFAADEPHHPQELSTYNFTPDYDESVNYTH